MSNEPNFTVGIEEEYLLVDRENLDLIGEAPPGMFEECERRLQGRVTPEFLQCQIEVGTGVCSTMQEARDDLANLRGNVAEVAEAHGLALLAASTHPFAGWEGKRRTERDRYATIAQDLQEVVRRLMICGMHVHVAVPDDDLRIDLLGQVAYILPHLLALSTSSPFWQGHDTGLKSYRLAVWNEMPRTGLPERFDSYREYQRHLDALIGAGLIEDGTKLWWDLRPSARFPTLEMRIADVCTRLDDALCIAAVYRCWLRMLYRLRMNNQRWREYRGMLLNENRWRAQRYGIDEGLVDFGKGEVVAYDTLLDDMLDLIAEDAEYLDCQPEVQHARTILTRGTSAHWQSDTYARAIADGADPQEALKQVVAMLVEQTVADLP
jgi:carboxylate-amine ligase